MSADDPPASEHPFPATASAPGGNIGGGLRSPGARIVIVFGT
jgi:hypothetical protein